MRIAANILPTADWATLRDVAVRADSCGLDAVGFLDHYHSEQAQWSWLSGWSVYGALAALTKRIRLVPMVIDRLNHLPGVLAKEASVLSAISGGRFELGIGAGDYTSEQRAWGLHVPDAATRFAALEETVRALRLVWTGELVSFEGAHVRLRDAACLPAPAGPVRVVVGAGKSRRLIRSAVGYADEVNVYADDEIVRFARDEIERSARDVALSVYVWNWSDDIEVRVRTWADCGADRAFLTFRSPYDEIETAASLAG